MCPGCPTKDWQGKSCWLHPPKRGQEVNQGPGDVITCPIWLGPISLGSQQNYQILLLIVTHFKTFYGFIPATLPRGEEDKTMKE